MEKLTIDHAGKAHEIIWTSEPFDYLSGRGVVVTDRHLVELYAEVLKPYDVIVLEPGESSKSLKTAEYLIDQLLERNLSRIDYVAAFGGGVVGDLTGFVAAIYKRGCRFYQIPTSIIAMVDSSVGGKTGINHGNYKNIIGAFYSPEKVMINEKYLETLPDDQWKNGSGEVLKYAFLDREVYDLIMENETLDWKRLVKSCLNVKKRYVEADFYDKGLRQHLNLGHTYGHAIERYDGTPHGIAVAYGIKMIIEAYGLNHLKHVFDMVCSRLGIVLIREYDKADLESYLIQDKKSEQGTRVFIVPEDIGKMRIVEVKHEI